MKEEHAEKWLKIVMTPRVEGTAEEVIDYVIRKTSNRDSVL